MSSQFKKWVVFGVIAVIVLAALLMALNMERYKTYRDYFRQEGPEIEMRYPQLTAAMTEPEARKHFSNLFLSCYSEKMSLGDRICYADVTRVDGLPAMTVALFFEKGRLKHSILQIPWWFHGRWLDRLVEDHGKAEGNRSSGLVGGPVLAWKLPGGLMEFNRDRGFNPLAWSVVFYTPAAGTGAAPAAQP
jgi:hypothetical protein